jgi:hypothetical protein
MRRMFFNRGNIVVKVAKSKDFGFIAQTLILKGET